MKEKIAEILVAAGYKVMDVPLHVAEHPYEFQGAFKGPREREEWVLLADIAKIPLKSLTRRMRSLQTAMYRSDRWKPVSLVAWGETTDQTSDLERLREVCRLIVVDEFEDLKLERQLRSLLPLDVPPPVSDGPTAMERLRTRLGDMRTKRLSQKLLRAATKGEEHVREAFVEHMKGILNVSGEDSHD